MEENEILEVDSLLRKLIQIRSENPPGNEREIAEFIKNYLHSYSIDSEFVEFEKGRTSLIAKLKGKYKSEIALCGHLDTVTADEKKWSKSPFEGITENGKMYGRGTADMKSGVAVILYTLILLKKKNVTPKYSILAALTADEEQEYRGARILLNKGYFDKTVFLIITEPTNLRVYTGHKGELWLRCKFYGKAAHGSTPNEGRNAITAACRFVSKINFQYKNVFKRADFFGKTTLNIGRFQGGIQVNIVPDFAEVELDIRVINEKEKEIAMGLVKIIGEKISILTNINFESEIFSYHPPVFASLPNEFIRKFKNAAGVKNVAFGTFCTDAATIVPVRKMPFVIFGPGKGAHQPDEYVELESFHSVIDTLFNFLREL